jgi:hypothetical protein
MYSRCTRIYCNIIKGARKEDKNAPAEKGDATVQEVFEIYQNTTSKHVEG